MTNDPANFSADVGNAHGPNWSKWLAHLIGKPGVAGLELGAWRGESAEWMLDNIFTGYGATYTCVDTFEGSEEHRLAGIDCSENERECRTRLARFGPQARIHRGMSNDFLRENYTAAFEAIYVDADHSAMGVLRDGVLGFDLLTVGGVMIFDDYGWTVMQQEIDRPKLAIDSFLNCYARRLEVIGVGWQVAVRKTA